MRSSFRPLVSNDSAASLSRSSVTLSFFRDASVGNMLILSLWCAVGAVCARFVLDKIFENLIFKLVSH